MNKQEYLNALKSKISEIEQYDEPLFEVGYVRNSLDGFIDSIDEANLTLCKLKNFTANLDRLEIEVVFIQGENIRNGTEYKEGYDQTLDNFLSYDTFFGSGSRSGEFMRNLEYALLDVENLGIKRGDPIRVLTYTEEPKEEVVDAFLSHFYFYPESFYTKGSIHCVGEVAFAYYLEPGGELFYSSLRTCLDNKPKIFKV